MKKTTTKNLFLTTALIAGMVFTLSSCHKDSSSSSSATITEAQAAEVTTDAVTPSTGGIVSQITSSAGFFTGATVTGGTVSSINNSHAITYSTIACGVVKDSTVAYASVAGAVPSYTYSLSWQNNLACSVPSTFTTNFTGKGTYDGITLSSSFTSTGSFVLSGLGAAATNYTFNSSYSRQGSTTSKVGDQNTFTHSLTITSTNIVYNKSEALIASGTAKVAITVTSTSGKSWVYGGTLTFLGNKTATLVLNSGVVYHISWS